MIEVICHLPAYHRSGTKDVFVTVATLDCVYQRIKFRQDGRFITLSTAAPNRAYRTPVRGLRIGGIGRRQGAFGRSAVRHCANRRRRWSIVFNAGGVRCRMQTVSSVLCTTPSQLVNRDWFGRPHPPSAKPGCRSGEKRDRDLQATIGPGSGFFASTAARVSAG